MKLKQGGFFRIKALFKWEYCRAQNLIIFFTKRPSTTILVLSKLFHGPISQTPPLCQSYVDTHQYFGPRYKKFFKIESPKIRRSTINVGSTVSCICVVSTQWISSIICLSRIPRDCLRWTDPRLWEYLVNFSSYPIQFSIDCRPDWRNCTTFLDKSGFPLLVKLCICFI